VSLRPPRVAFFTDSFHEVNGVGLTSRQLDAFARRREYPFFSCHAGETTQNTTDGAVETFELKRGLCAFPVEADLYVDPLLNRYYRGVRQALEAFQPDLIHITGPNDISLLGALLARNLRVPMTASWHTNVHEFAAWRLQKSLRLLPKGPVDSVARNVEKGILWGCGKLYGAARHCFAPNPELVAMLQQRTGKGVDVMHRGVEIELYHPAKRDRDDDVFELGYVGRISAEKNVRFLKTLEEALLARGRKKIRITVVGHGNEQPWLEQNLETGAFPGVLKGEALARAYANFDLFVFPSFTDTYGNVVNEAMSSGVPCVVTNGGGPKYLIEDGKTGVAARNEDHFIDSVAALIDDPDRHARMREAARAHAVENSWDRVFERLYDRYAEIAGTAVAQTV